MSTVNQFPVLILQNSALSEVDVKALHTWAENVQIFYASQAPQVTAPNPTLVGRYLPEHAKLMTFYSVNSYFELVNSMERHIERLQRQLPKREEVVINNVRAG